MVSSLVPIADFLAVAFTDKREGKKRDAFNWNLYFSSYTIDIQGAADDVHDEGRSEYFPCRKGLRLPSRKI